MTYEELVYYPEQIINKLTKKFNLNEKNQMLKKVHKPSRTTSSSKTSKKILELSEEERKKYLLSKWKNVVNEEDISRIQSLLNIFEIDLYNANDYYPKSNYLLNSISSIDNTNNA